MKYSKSSKQLAKQKEKWIAKGRLLFAEDPIAELELSPIDKAKEEARPRVMVIHGNQAGKDLEMLKECLDYLEHYADIIEQEHITNTSKERDLIKRIKERI